MSDRVLQLIEKEKKERTGKLDLSFEDLETIPTELEGLTWLKELNLSDNQISDICFLEKLTGLQTLHLSDNQISDIRSLEKLTGLQTLDLSSNKISDIRSLEKLTVLQSLDLSDNQISDYSFLEKLSGLQTLYLSSNKISDIPSLEKLTSLQTLDLSSNKISDIRFLEKLTGLLTLYLSDNKISDCSFLEKLNGLQTLYLSDNKISDYSFLEKLNGLQIVDLSTNRISDIRFLEKLTGLQTLYLSDNKISDIRFLEKLTGLQIVNLNNNKISDIGPLAPLLKKGIDISLEEYKYGSIINLFGNPITTPPIEIVKQGREAVLRYFEELEEEEVRPLNEAKLLIIGAGGVGKTSFMFKLRNPEANLPGEKDTTVGITVSQEPKKFTIDNQENTLHIWDFGGQDIYHPTHQFFLTKNSIYILMQDGREQKTDFYYWLQVQELLAANSPLFIFQNIKNNIRCPIPTNELKGKFDNIKDYFELDLAAVKKGHKDFEHIERVLQTTHQGLPQIGDPWPARRFAIRDKLISMRDMNFISYHEYQEICNNFDYADPQGQKELAQQLHDLGTVLHFQDVPALEDIVITNPQWATDAVYEILNHTKKHYEKRGHFTWKDLKTVWSEQKYRGVYYEILALMERFELCFDLPDEKYTYIAPLLLPDDQPEYPWPDQGNLQMMYRYDFMPKGIMARLIVKLHRYIKENTYWQRGVVLEYKNTQAEVTEDYASRNISVSVHGEYAKELIFMIYSAIDEINTSYYFSDRMKASKLVPCNCKECQNRETPHFYDYEQLQLRIRKNKQTIECAVSFEDVKVKSLLEYITPDKLKEEAKSAQLFISYAREDLKYKDQFEKALSALKREEQVQVWSDIEIEAGEKWNQKIEKNLNRADIIVLLLSFDFIQSEYIWEKEIPIVMERYAAKAAKLVPILVRECNWEDTKLKGIQVEPIEPDSMKLLPISNWDDPDTAWKIVVKGIKKLI